MKPENIINYKYLKPNTIIQVYTHEFYGSKILDIGTACQILSVKLNCGECYVAVNYVRITLLNLKTFVIEDIWVHKEKQCSQFNYYES